MTTNPDSHPPTEKLILLVEDDPATVAAGGAALARSGYSVAVAASVAAATNALLREMEPGFQAVLLASNLPDGDPSQVAEVALSRRPPIPVVLVTDTASATDTSAAWRNAIADCVQKDEELWQELPGVIDRATRLHRLQEQLARSNALLLAIAESSSDMVLVCDREGHILYLSPVCETTLGFSSEAVAGHSWGQIVFSEDLGNLQAILDELVPNVPKTFSFRCSRKDGEMLWVDATAKLLPAVQYRGGQLVVLTLRDVTSRRAFEQGIEAALREKEVLLREIHHRVNNNLQVIQSLLKMRARSLPEGPARAAVASTVERVRAMALVHEKLYQAEDLAALSLPNYVKDLLNQVVSANSSRPERIRLELQVEPLQVSLEAAIPLGLLLTELVSNAIRHGFPDGRAGRVKVSLLRQDQAIRLEVQDDGVGISGTEGFADSSAMGLKLAAGLAHQLGGKLSFHHGSGCSVSTTLERALC